MRKLILFALATFLFLGWAVKSQALSVVDPNRVDQVKNLYSGSILLEDNNFTQKLWYVKTDTKEIYPLSNLEDLDYLLKQAEIISSENINKIMPAEEVDFAYSYQMRGHFLLDADSLDSFWYVNPIDGQKYQISNDTNGLNKLKNLAIDIDQRELTYFTKAELASEEETEENLDFSLYKLTKTYLQENYYDPSLINDRDLFYGSLKGMVNSLNDPYTEFFTAQNKKQFDDRLNSQVEGIGAMVDSKNNRLVIISPLENSPAMKAGILAGDEIWFVDGVDIRGYTVAESTALIKGPEGTDVRLTVYRPSTDTLFEKIVTRERIVLQNITAKKLDNNIVYFKINIFSPSLKNEFENLKEQYINQNTSGLIIDLRNNPGGYTHSAVNLAEYWLDEGEPILKEQYRNRSLSYTARTQAELDKIPTVILINGGTASAAEIFTLAVRHNTNHLVVGESSFGKGSGQQISQFDDGSALKFTVFHWYGPLNNSINGLGIKPDFEISNTRDDIDAQLQKAQDLLR